jgi:hypothetical protein
VRKSWRLSQEVVVRKNETCTASVRRKAGHMDIPDLQTCIYFIHSYNEIKTFLQKTDEANLMNAYLIATICAQESL